MRLMPTELARHRGATALALVLVVLTAAAFTQGCVTGKVQTAQSIGNSPEFRGYLTKLAADFESLNTDRILSQYSPTEYDVSFETPYKVTTGTTEHRSAVAALVAKMKQMHIVTDPDFEAYQDGDRVWTIIGFKATGEMKDGKTFAYNGWHSAIWDKKDGKWAIWYEHFGGKPEAAATPAPAAAAVPLAGAATGALAAAATGAAAPAVAPAPAAKPIEIPFGDVFFDFDKWAIRPDQIATLQKNIELLNSHPDVRILIEGHCDERGGESYNFGLGDRRAEAVKNYLVGKGVAHARLAVVSYGKDKPFELGHGEPMWGKNRRAHFVVIPD